MNATECACPTATTFMIQPLIQDIILTFTIGAVLVVARWLGIKIKG